MNPARSMRLLLFLLLLFLLLLQCPMDNDSTLCKEIKNFFLSCLVRLLYLH
jgi:hypothetical protein